MKGIHLCAFAFLGAAVPNSLSAQAFCALREPVREIKELFPTATSHVSYLGTVGDSARKEVARRVPFEMDFDELGRHTLYAVLSGSRPIGFVHVRPEEGPDGRLEVAWALDLQLRLLDFRVQRSRQEGLEALETPAFRRQIQGLGLRELQQLLEDDGQGLQVGQLAVPEHAAPVAHAVLRSAFKAIVVTEATWWRDLGRVRMLAAALDDLPHANSVQTIEHAFTEEVLARLMEAWLEPPSVAWTQASAVLDPEGETVGVVIRSLSRMEKGFVPLLWTVDTERRLLGVRAERGWPDEWVREAFEGLEGNTFAQVSECMTYEQAVAAAILTIADVHLGPE